MQLLNRFINFNVIFIAVIFLLFMNKARGSAVLIENSNSNNDDSNGNDKSNSNNDENKIEPRSLLSDIARELISRTGTNSQVLSLNLTNLIILLILKGLLFGAALVGSGTLKGRSLEQNIYENLFKYDNVMPSKISESELTLFLSYLMGETNQNYDCLKRVACNETGKATQYLMAGKMFISGVKLLKDVIPVNEKYENLIGELEHAISFGKNGGNCSERYFCTI